MLVIASSPAIIITDYNGDTSFPALRRDVVSLFNGLIGKLNKPFPHANQH
jgi:hypothetical protein